MLYPIKFKPQYQQRLWGGKLLEKTLNKKLPKDKAIGESWEISSIEDNISIVSNGILKGNSIDDIIEIYMGDLVGDAVYEKFGLEFPLLYKFLGSEDILSIQVHPNNELAESRHGCWGKSEMWHIIDAEPGAVIYLGFNKDVEEGEYLQACIEGDLPKLLNKIEVKKGESYSIPSGEIHALGKGIVVAEIQQSSDITYRVHDWNRLQSNGEPRDLHEDMAMEALNFKTTNNENITKEPITNEAVELIKCEHFTVNIVELDGEITRDYSSIDSFVVYQIIEGELKIDQSKATKGETILIPAALEQVCINGKATILESYIG